VPTKQRFTVTTDCQYASVPEALAECRDAGLLRTRIALRCARQHCDTPIPGCRARP
jgi:hypothetical protein